MACHAVRRACALWCEHFGVAMPVRRKVTGGDGLQSCAIIDSGGVCKLYGVVCTSNNHEKMARRPLWRVGCPGVRWKIDENGMATFRCFDDLAHRWVRERRGIEPKMPCRLVNARWVKQAQVGANGPNAFFNLQYVSDAQVLPISIEDFRHAGRRAGALPPPLLFVTACILSRATLVYAYQGLRHLDAARL